MKVDKSKYTGNELLYLKQVLKSGKLGSTSGDFVQRFEQEFAKSFGAKYAIACNSGTSALHMALEAAGVGYGDEVILPALSVIMNTTSILHANAIPVYADVDPKTFTLDPESVKKKMSSRTKAIVSVSLYGYPSRVEEIADAVWWSVPIIEDNAEHIGSLRSSLATYSLESTKHFSAGEGGVVITDNEKAALSARLLCNHGFKNSRADNGKTKSDVNVFQDPDYLRHTSVGWNYRFTEFGAAIGLAQLERKEEILGKRRSFAHMFDEVFNEYSDKFVIQEHHQDHTYWTYAVRCLEDKEFWRKLHRQFVEAGGAGFWSAWQLQYLEPVMKYGEFRNRCPDLYRRMQFGLGLCPVAEQIQPQLMQFKLNYREESLVEEQVSILAKVLKNV